MVSKRNYLIRRVLLAGFFVAFFATGCSTFLPSEEVATDYAPVPTSEATPEQPTPGATPLSIPAPTPTPDVIPEFGPTGRPTARGETHHLTLNSSFSRPEVYDAPDGNPMTVMYESVAGGGTTEFGYLTNPTWFGNPLVMLVREGEPGDDWAKVQIPTRPITTGWVKTEHFEWGTSNFYVQINVGNNTLTVWDGDKRIVDQQAVVTGKSSTWTPTAATFIDEKMPGPSAAYGPNLMSIGMFSQAMDYFGGGLPKVAMHGTNQPGLMGQYASNGCVRMPNDVVAMLAATLPAGTRVDVVNNPDGSTGIRDLLNEDDLVEGQTLENLRYDDADGDDNPDAEAEGDADADADSDGTAEAAASDDEA